MNLTINTSAYKEYPLQARSRNEVITETLMASVLFMLGVAGNGLVCYVIFKKRFTSSSMYFFMLNLACADLLVCFASIPLTLLSSRPHPVDVNFGPVGCKVIRFVQYMLPPASVAILTATAIDRYFHICIPLRRIITTRATKQLAMVCWGSAFLLTVPIFFLIETEKVIYKGSIYEFCNIKETVTFPKAGSIYLVFRGAFGFAIPLVVIMVLYFKVVRTVWKRDSRHGSTNRQRANVVKSLLTVVVAFFLSWAPFSICNKYYLFVEPHSRLITREEIITFWVGLSASVYNPVIYAFYNKKFRNAFVSVFKTTDPQSTQATTQCNAVGRPRSQTLPALFSTEPDKIAKERGNLMVEGGNSHNLQTHGKTRHLSIGFQPVCEDEIKPQEARIKKVTFSNNVDDLFSSNGCSEKTISKIQAVDKLHLQSSSAYTNGSLMIPGHACSLSSQNFELFDQPTLVRTKTKDKSNRKTGLANLIPEIQTTAQCQTPSDIKRSQTFRLPRHSPAAMSHDCARSIRYSRYKTTGSNKMPFLRSTSFNDQKTFHFSRNTVVLPSSNSSTPQLVTHENRRHKKPWKAKNTI